MPGWGWALIIIAAVVVVAVVMWRALAARRTRSLRERFGPEYDRTTTVVGGRRAAEAELAGRQERREQLNIRPLPPESRQRYARQWETVQAQFVDLAARGNRGRGRSGHRGDGGSGLSDR